LDGGLFFCGFVAVSDLIDAYFARFYTNIALYGLTFAVFLFIITLSSCSHQLVRAAA
jgi:hypothetical protein